MILTLRAIIYALFHPTAVLHLTVVRRYVDAQKNFIGELYEGEGRTAKMIGASCDSWPFNANLAALPFGSGLCWQKDFLAPLPANTLRVGALKPEDNAAVQRHIAIRRFCILRITVLNRFVEHVMEADCARAR